MEPGAGAASGEAPKPHEVRIHEASGTDTSQLSRMHLDAAQSLGAMPKGAPLVEELSRGSLVKEADTSFGEDLAAASVMVFVASLGEVPVGYGVVRCDGDRGRIDELWVDPEARCVGVGTALFTALKAAAAAAGMTGLDSVALPGDRNTKNFFEDHSMVARAIVVGTSEL